MRLGLMFARLIVCRFAGPFAAWRKAGAPAVPPPAGSAEPTPADRELAGYVARRVVPRADPPTTARLRTAR